MSPPSSGNTFASNSYSMTHTHQHTHPTAQQPRSWLATYKPIILIFAYILGATIFLETAAGEWSRMRWMNHFMAGFFLTFSFFKLLDLKGFADSYAEYDLLARAWDGWGYLYPFVELLLGLAYLVDFQPVFTNAVTLVLLTISLIGVLQSVLHRRKIRCACLGAVFNLPMSTITIIEDASMILMSAIALKALYLG